MIVRNKSEASALEKTVPVGHSSGASNVTWPIPSYTVDLLFCGLIKLLQFFLNMKLFLLVILPLH